MDRQEPLSLPHTFKSTHGPLSNSRRLMGKLHAVISILTGIMNRVRDELSMGDLWGAELLICAQIKKISKSCLIL
jgi:hypothetical protein